MKIEKLNVRVKLLEVGGYTPAEENPVVGSEYECEGVVICINGEEEGFSREEVINILKENEVDDEIDILWDNDEINLYCGGDLEIINENLEYKSIW